jgi:predicted RNA polymerase sigma factor
MNDSRRCRWCIWCSTRAMPRRAGTAAPKALRRSAAPRLSARALAGGEPWALSLMLLHDSRSAARFDSAGDVVLLETGPFALESRADPGGAVADRACAARRADVRVRDSGRRCGAARARRAPRPIGHRSAALRRAHAARALTGGRPPTPRRWAWQAGGGSSSRLAEIRPWSYLFFAARADLLQRAGRHHTRGTRRARSSSCATSPSAAFWAQTRG